MAALEISAEFSRRLQAFKPVVDAVLQEKMEWEQYVETVLHIGLDHMLTQIISNPEAAIATLRKLAEFEPEIVFKLIALGWEKANEEERNEAKRRLEECKKHIL
jgi:hypothetical protein